MFGLYVIICLVVAIFIFLNIHTHSDSAGITFIELLISFPWASVLVMWVIMGLALTACEEFIKYVKGENNEKENL